MAATVWNPRLLNSKQRWLLTDGQLVETPDLEETPSGRRVRIAGTTISGWAKDILDVINAGVQSQYGAKLWMQLGDASDPSMDRTFGVDMSKTSALHLLAKRDPNTQYRGESSDFVWKFVSAEGIPAYLVLTVSTGWYENVLGEHDSTLRVNIYYADTRVVSVKVQTEYNPAFVVLNDEGKFTNTLSKIWHINYDDRMEWEKYLDTQGSEFLLPAVTAQTAGDAMKALLHMVAKIDSLETIQIPDLRDPENVREMLDLHFVSSTVPGTLASDIADYLDGLPKVSEALDYYDKLVTVLRQIGVVTVKQNATEIAKALSSLEGITIEIKPKAPMSPDGTYPDHQHVVRFNLAAGLVQVDCENDFDVNAHQEWREAMTIASLTGQEDELLEYARAKTAQKRQIAFDEAIARKTV